MIIASRSEHLFPSSRADEVGVAIHKGAKADLARKWIATPRYRSIWYDSKNSPCEKSGFERIFSIFRLPQKLTDRRASPSGKTRNDRNLKSDSAKDSRIFESQAQNVFCSQAAGRRICDEKRGLCSGEQGNKTKGGIDAASQHSCFIAQNQRPNQKDSICYTKP